MFPAADISRAIQKQTADHAANSPDDTGSPFLYVD
jgi:hypothetical protein